MFFLYYKLFILTTIFYLIGCMIIHPTLTILCVDSDTQNSRESFYSYLRSMPHVTLTVKEHLPDDLSLYHVIATAGSGDSPGEGEWLPQFVQQGGGWLCLAPRSELSLPHIFGARLSAVEPAAEVRVSFRDTTHPIARRMPFPLYLSGPYQGLVKAAEDTEVIMCADWHYQHMPVMVSRKAATGMVACTTLQAYDNPFFCQVLYRLLTMLASRYSRYRPHAPLRKSIGVGILGYAQSVGQLHGLGVLKTDELELSAACDLNPERLRQAELDFPGIKVYTAADDLASDPDVHLVIVATAPNTHATLALEMMSRGKHVVCEKPLALNRREADSMLEMSLQQKVHLSCHQNRRFDVDYRAIKQALTDGLIGDLFYMETFVGGFSHPCGYWHSHEPISGGTAYDWGGHYLDWIVSLLPSPIQSVTATSHKRVWHDVTNADQERIHMLFSGGEEAEFIHSDVAAARKPKWYLLGTEGAIVSTWRDVTHYEIDPALYFHQQEIPATEMPPDLTAYRRHRSGEIVCQTLPIPRREHFLFHRNLADHLLTGEPLGAPLNDSVKVVTILEAAKKSALKGCSVEIGSG